VLWVRTTSLEEGFVLGVTDKSGFIGGSMNGVLFIHTITLAGENIQLSKWFVATYPPGEGFWLPHGRIESAVAGFRLNTYRDGGFFLAAPHWFCFVVSSLFAITIYFKRSYRFSLRTLLIATTLVAVVLGIIVVAR